MPDSPTPLSPTESTPAAPMATGGRPRRSFVLITGLSGAGRATALRALEDLGYVAIDNMPLPLLGDLIRSTGGLVGTPEEIIHMLREREAMGLKEIALLPAMPTARRNLRDFAEQVIARY